MTAKRQTSRKGRTPEQKRAEMAEASWQGGQALPRWTDRAEAFRAEIAKAAA